MIMSKEKTESKPLLKSTLKFFNSQLTDLNTKRLQVNRGKGLAKFFARSQKQLRDISSLETTLGIMSFSLYMLRFAVNLGLLVQIIIEQDETSALQANKKELYYTLMNDSLWCMVNLTQFFWLSFSKSTSAGFYGMQLETLAQFFDLFVMIFRHQQDKEEFDLKYNQATEMDRGRIIIEWQYKELQFYRSLLTSLSILTMFGLYSFSITAVPLSPIISAIILMSSLSRILMDVEKDRKLTAFLQQNENNFELLSNEKKGMSKARLNDLNQVILSSIFLPIGLFLLLTTPIPITILASLSMLLVHALITHLISFTYEERPPLQLNS